MLFSELQKSTEEILLTLERKLLSTNSTEPLLRSIPNYMLEVTSAISLLENKKYSLKIGKQVFICGISGETQLKSTAEKGDIYSQIVWGLVCIRKKNFKIGFESLKQLRHWDIPDDLQKKIKEEYLHPAYLEYGKSCYMKSLSEKSGDYFRQEAISYLGYVTWVPEAADMLAECLGGIDKWAATYTHYKTGAQAGLPNSCYSMGYFYHQRAKEPARAIELYRTAAAKGHKKAAYFLSECLIEIKEPQQAAEIYLRLAKENFMSAKEKYIQCIEHHNLPKTTDYYNLKSFNGNTFELYQAGINYENGVNVPKDTAKAISYFLKAAEAGYEQAQYNMATRYETGNGIGKNLAQAYKWYKRSGDQGNRNSAYKVAIIYEWVGYKEQATEWYRKAGASYELGKLLFQAGKFGEAYSYFRQATVTNNNPDIYFYLGILMYRGLGTTKDTHGALQYFQKSGTTLEQYYIFIGQSNHPDALCDMGMFYKKSNPNKAAAYFMKAALQGHIEAAYQTAKIYDDGIGVTENRSTALDWYKKAAQGGNVDAKYELGRSKYLNKEYKEALTLLQTAANLNNTNANYYLGLMYYLEYGVSKDLNLAFRYFNKAGSYLYTNYYLGIFYYYGYGQSQVDYYKAFLCFGKQESISPEMISEYYIGLCYKNGQGINQSLTMAFRYFEKSATKGYKLGEYELGLCYQKGTGVSMNADRALEWFLKSAEQGMGSAQYEAGYMLYSYSFKQKNPEQGKQWLQKACDQNVNAAVRMLIDIHYNNGRFDETGKLIPKAKEILGFFNAHYYEAMFFHHGIGGYPKNAEKALYSYKRFATYMRPKTAAECAMVEAAREAIFELEHPTLSKIMKIVKK